MFEKLLKILKITDEITSVIRSNSDKNKLLEKVDESVKEKLWPNLGGASVFVLWCSCILSDIIKSPKRTNPPWTFWYASSKHIPYSNKLPSQFVTNTPYVSPLKNCRTVVRQFLYYGVRVPTTRNNKNSEADIYLLRYFGTLEGTSSKHTPCLNNFAEQNRNKHFVCFSSPHKVKDFVGTPK